MNPDPGTGGVPAFSIGGRMVHQRERLAGMTDEERRWRAQYLKDQILVKEEPVFSPELYKNINNPFRRIWRYPIDLFGNLLMKKLSYEMATKIKKSTSKLLWLFALTYIGTYYVKYHGDTWHRVRIPLTFKGPPLLLPGDPGYPTLRKFEKWEYYDLGANEEIERLNLKSCA